MIPQKLVHFFRNQTLIALQCVHETQKQMSVITDVGVESTLGARHFCPKIMY